MQSPLIAIPKKQSEFTDWVAPLKSFIRANYGEAEKYTEECNSINRFREDMRGAGEDLQGRDLLYRYYGQLELLGLHFPIGEENVKLTFTWYDAFSFKAVTQHSLAFEKASVLFNMAALCSAIAAAQDRSDQDGMKLAFNLLQAAAGILEYISENFLHAPSSDLDKDTLKSLSAMMLAQAQEVFLERAIYDQKKNTLVSRIASQASTMYNTAVEKSSELVATATVERSLLSGMSLKSKYMMSIARLYQAKADVDENNYGKALAHLNEAMKLGKEARLYPIYDLMGQHLGKLQEIHKSVSRDNDFIYHQHTPSDLPPIGKLPAAKPTSLQEMFTAADMQRIVGGDVFQNLVPMSVLETLSMYSEEKAKLVRQENERVTEADENIASTLEFYGLPDSLDQFRSPSEHQNEFKEMPEDIAKSSQQVQPLGPRFETMSNKAQRLVKLTSELSVSLDQEKRECENMRKRYGSSWTQPPSANLTMDVRDRIRTLRSNLDKAIRTDRQMDDLYRSNQEQIEALKDASSHFQKAVQNNTQSGASLLDLEDNDNNAAAIKADEIGENLRKLNLVKRERNQTLSDIRQKVREDDISNVLVLSRKNTGSDSEIFESELEKYRPFQIRITASIKHQEQLLSEIRSIFKMLMDDPSVKQARATWNESKQSYDGVISKFRKAWEVYQEVDEGTLRGLSFYESATSDGERLQKDVNDFIERRRSEGGTILERSESARPQNDQQRLRESLDRMSLGGSWR